MDCWKPEDDRRSRLNAADWLAIGLVAVMFACLAVIALSGCATTTAVGPYGAASRTDHWTDSERNLGLEAPDGTRLQYGVRSRVDADGIRAAGELVRSNLAEVRGFLAPFGLTIGSPSGPVAIPPAAQPMVDAIRAAGLDVVPVRP